MNETRFTQGYVAEGLAPAQKVTVCWEFARTCRFSRANGQFVGEWPPVALPQPGGAVMRAFAYVQPSAQAESGC